MRIEVIQGVLLPFLGTILGAGCVFFMRGGLRPMLQRALTGFAAGVMVAASIWSLLVPAMEQAEDMGQPAFLPAVLGFWLGILFLLALDRTVPHLHQDSSQPEGLHAQLKRTTMLVLAVTLHNIPEGAIISMPLRGAGTRRRRAFLYGVLSGAVEPIAALLTIWAARLILPALPYLLSFAAGAMVYVVVEELVPEASAGAHSNLGTLFFAFGFTLMLWLDVALG